ncbi:hypothetical protein Hanom_Chr03g00182051 [Helianthus anomalus]
MKLADSIQFPIISYHVISTLILHWDLLAIRHVRFNRFSTFVHHILIKCQIYQSLNSPHLTSRVTTTSHGLSMLKFI